MAYIDLGVVFLNNNVAFILIQCDMVERIGKEDSGAVDSSIKSEIDTLFVIDRDVDLITPMVTPLTYEALIDEIIGIESGAIKVYIHVFPIRSMLCIYE